MQFFRMANLGHVKREANSAVHGLAREAVTHILDSIWMKEILPWIYDIVIRELLVPML